MEKIITAELSVQSDKIEAFLKLAKIVISKSNAEKGCLTYKLLKEFDHENEFFFFEKYENQKAVEAHNTSEHFKNFIDGITPLLSKEPVIEIFNA